MSDATPPNPPIPPAQPGGAPQPPGPIPPPQGYGVPPRVGPPPGYGIDNTGAPGVPAGAPQAVGAGFFKALFDFSFRTFITRRLASVFYIIGLIVLAIGFLVYFFGGLIAAFGAMRYNTGSGVLLLLGTLVAVPILTFLGVIILRFWIEAVVALIAIAENTERTAEHTKRP